MTAKISEHSEKLLELLEEKFPEGISTSDLAAQIYGGATEREKARVYRLARALRDVGYAVYGLGGVYYLCDARKLALVGKRKVAAVAGVLKGAEFLFAKAAELLRQEPAEDVAGEFAELRRRFGEALKRAASG